MEKKLPGNLSEILRFEERISVKNRQLIILKQLSAMLSEIEDEETFVQQAVPLIKGGLSIKTELLIYLEMGGKPTSVTGFDVQALQALYENIKDVVTPRNSPVVIDLSVEEEHDPLWLYANQGYSKCIIASVHEKSKPIGFLGIPAGEDYTLGEDEKIFIKHLAEIIGIFFNYINLKRNLRDTKTRMENQFQDLRALYTVSKSLGGHLDTRTILENALDTMLSQEVLDIQAKGGIFLLNEEANLLEMVSYRNIGSYLAETEKTIELGHCLCGRVAQTGEMMTSLDCFEDKRHDTQYEGMTLHGHINLPLKTDKHILGVLFLYLPGHVQPTENQINLLTSIANQLSIALENAKLFEKVRHLSVHDPLTNLYNRKMLFDRLEEEQSRAERTGKPLSLAMVDIDFFKKVNDTFGHAAGDMVLKELAGLLKGSVRKIDTVARFGGEEFAVLLPEASLENGGKIMERFRALVEKHPFPIDEQGGTAPVTVSIGLSIWPQDSGVDPSAALNEADTALYRAKEEGRNRVCPAGE